MTAILEGKTALITGAGSGIGRATALVFARERARLILADRAAEGLNATVDLVRKSGGQAIAVVADVSQSPDVERIINSALEHYGRLDCAYNNAGVHGSQLGAAGARLMDIPETAFDSLMAVNLKGVWLCMKHEIAQMVRQGGGVIVNTGSIGGIVGLVGSAAYVATKHGVLGLTKTAALEYAQSGIRVNAVCPGFVDTPMATESMQRRGADILNMIPLRRLAKPEEIGETVAFLCSDRASYVSGTCYCVDGAFLA